MRKPYMVPTVIEHGVLDMKDFNNNCCMSAGTCFKYPVGTWSTAPTDEGDVDPACWKPLMERIKNAPEIKESDTPELDSFV
jgi:hypothetical protein